MNEYQKALKIQEKPKLPPDLSKSSQQLDDYLSTLKESCEQDQRKQLSYRRMTNTRIQNALTRSNIVEDRKVVICKKYYRIQP